MSLTRKWLPSPNFNTGRSHSPRLIVLHTAEGSRSVESLGNFFANPAVEASSHAGADDTPKTIGVYVKRENRAWTQVSFNSDAVSIEMCAFARWPTEEWDKHPALLENVARWIAEESKFFGIPIVRLSVGEAQGSGRGVCQHVDLGSRGGGHTDCGPGFPMDRVLEMARLFQTGAEPEQLTTWYYLQDVAAPRLARGQRMYYGGISTKKRRDDLSIALTKGFLHPFRNFRDDDFGSPYFIDNSAYVKEIYGGWKSKAGRDKKRVEFESSLGRPLRPFSENRTEAQGGVPWGCRNLQRP